MRMASCSIVAMSKAHSGVPVGVTVSLKVLIGSLFSGSWASPDIGQHQLYLPEYFKTYNNVDRVVQGGCRAPVIGGFHPLCHAGPMPADMLVVALPAGAAMQIRQAQCDQVATNICRRDRSSRLRLSGGRRLREG